MVSHMPFLNRLSRSNTTLERVLGDAEELERAFADWRVRYRRWMRYAFPDGHSSVNAQLGSFYNSGGTKTVNTTRSRYISEWVPTRARTLINRRTSAKTNVISQTYETEQGKAEGEWPIELARGLFKMADQQVFEGMGGISWDVNLKTMGTNVGKEAFMVRVYDAGNGRAKVEAPFIDPYNLFHDVATNEGERHRVIRKFTVPWRGVPDAVRKWQRGRPDALSIPEKPRDRKLGDPAVIIDYWRRDPDKSIWHAMFVEGNPIRASVEWNDHGYRRFPIVVSSNAGANQGFYDVRDNTLRNSKYYNHAEPFYVNAINLLIFLEGLEGLNADGAALSSLPMFKHRVGEGGARGVEESDIQPGGFYELAEGELLEVMRDLQQGRITTDQAIQRIKEDLNAVWPDFLVSPNVPQGTSGFSFNSQISQAKTFMVTETLMDEKAKTEFLRCAIDQHQNMFSDLDFGLSGILPEGGTRLRLFKAADYPDDFELDIQEPAEIPGEVLQNIQKAKGVLELGILSMWDVRVDLGVGQPHVIQQRIDDEAIHDHPINQQDRILQVRQSELDGAKFALRTATEGGENRENIINLRILVHRAQERVADVRRQFLGQGLPFQQAPQPGNPPPEALPPQAGLNSPNDQALAEGVSPSGTGGRPRPEGTA